MASIHDEPIMPTVHKLPAINTGRLVSGSGKGSSVHLESASDTWAIQVRRRLQEQVNNGDKPGEELVVQLVQQVVSAFISTLQNDRRPSWLYLCDVLCLLEPHAQLLQGRQQITHYLERVYNHVQTHQERLFDLNIVPALNKVFPKDMERIQHTGGNPRNYRTPTPPRLLSSTPTTSTKRTSVSSSTGLQLPDGSNPYVLERPDDETRYFRPKPLSVGDIRAAIPAVVLEASSRESVWGTSMGITATAMSLDLHDELKPAPPATMSQSLTSIIESKLDEDVSISEEAESISDAPPLTGREAAEMFVKGKHLGKVEFVYLNLTPNRHFRPYDLVVVPKQKINKEHYVFSRFGALHVRPNEPNDTMSIADWNQEAVWWSALTCIPFFKHFLVRKAFLRWKSYKRYEDFCRIREDVEENLPLAVPRFGAALLHISRLLLELTAINILPASTNTCFTLPEFEAVIKKKRKEAEKILSKFFGYSQAVVNQIVSEVFEHLQHCEQQVKQTKTVYTKESLYLQRQKKEQRVQNFKKAKGVASRLGNFVKLVDQILLAHMVSLARTNIGAFVHKTMQAGEEAERDALFKAKLVFNKNDELILYPSKEKFQNATYSALLGIPAVIFRSAHPSEDGASTQGSPGTGSRGRGESSLSSPVKLNVSQESARPQPQPSTGSKRDQSSMQTSRSGAVTGNTSNYTLADPTLERPAMKTKDEDRMGVATPDLVVGAQTPRGLTVGGQGFMGQYSPLSKGSLETKLATDEVVSADVQLHEDMMLSALAEIDSFCIEHVWTKPMHKYAREWSRSVLKTFHGQEAFDIEEKLNEIKNWIERLKDVEKSVQTSDGLFEVDCSVLQQDLVPALSNIFKQLIQLVADDAKNLSSNFVEEIKKLSKTLKDQNTSVDQFAVFAGQVKEYRNRTQQLQEKVSYIKSLYEVIRMSYRSLNPDEEKLEERVRTTWESFLVQLQEAHDFVHTQTPVMLEELDQTYQTLHEEALMISRQATSGQFLDPSKHAPTILVDMRHLAEKFSAVQHKMEEISRWREMITGTGYDLSALEFMVGQMDVRRELWKYVEVATYHIKDWKQQLFRKMNVKKAMGKLTEWQTAAMMMADEVPQGDRVLAHWVNMMQDFKQNLPLLAKLGSDALKHRHWKQLYVGMGKDPSEMGWSMTVGDLIDLDLPKYSQLINQIFTAATSEFSLEQSLGKLRRMWEEKEFKLAKYIRELPVRREKKRTGSPVARLQAAKSRSRTRIVTEETYILIGTDELRYQLEDTEVTLQAMLASPHIADLRSQAEVWRVTLQQVDDIIHLWTECQTKWLFLSKSFADIDLVLQLPDEAAMFSEVDKKYKAFMQDVVEDPKMLSVLSKRRGQKGWRELQGEALRQLLKWCIEEQEKIIKKLDNKLMATRNEFPRLHFLSNSEIVELLSLSRDPRTMTSFVKKCFHGIRALNFALPAEVNHTTTALDLDLHAEVLQATAMKGESGEVVDLVHRVEANTQTTQWLLAVEQTMRNTVGTSLQACLEARLGKTPMTTQTWVRLFPSQCVVLAEAVLWARDVSLALRNSDRQRLMDLRSSISSSLEDRLGILRELYRDQSIRKTHITLGNLVNQAVHQRDIISMLLEAKALTENCFDWQKVMKYSMDIKPVPKSTVHKWRETSQVEDTCEPERIRQALDVRQGFEFGPCLVNQLNWSLPYDYEYLGPVNRLIHTPLTDRCLLSLSGSVQSYGCGAVMGPEGVGKSETVAELARAMGRNYITFNCTHQTGISALTQHLVGGVQSGTWVCLDDAGHLPTGVMSVLSHHLDHLRNAYRILAASSESQYTIRSSQTARKRRRTVTSLASFSAKDHQDSWQTQDTGQHRRHSLFGTDQKELSSAQSTLPLDLQGFTKSWQATSAFSYEPRTLGLVTYNNSLMNANANFSPFLTLNTRDQSFQTIPETLRSAYRPVTLIVPDRKLVVQSILLCGGFQGHRLLARKLETFLQLLEKQLLSVETPAVSLHTVKVMLALAQQELQTRWLQLSSSGSAERESVLRPNSAEMEEMALVRGVSSTLIPTLQNPDEVSRVKDLLRTAFPVSNRPASAKTNDPILINAIQEHMEADKLQATPKHLDKILQLWAALQAQQGVMLVGPSGSGKTTTYRVLAEVLNILNENIYASQETPDIYPTPKISKSRLVGSLERRMTQEDMRRKALDDSPDKPRSTKSINRMDLASLPEVDYPRVDGAVLVPNAHSLEDLLGFYDPDDHFWKDGLLTNFLRNALHTAEAAKKMIQNFQSSDRRSKTNLSEPSTVYQWIIMDGRFDPPWSESVVTLLDQNRGIHLTNGDTIALEPTTSLLLEMSELRGASPSLVGRSAIVYFEDGEHIWRSTVESWFLNAFNRWTVTAQTVKVWTDLINDVFPQTIELLSSNTVSVLDVDTSYSSRARSPCCSGLQEVSSFLSILSSLLNKHMARDPTDANSVRSQSPRDETRSQASWTSAGSQRRMIRLEDLSPSNQAIVSQSMFVFAYIWGFGGHLHERHTAAFDLFARKVLSQASHQILIPPIGSVYDYCIDTKNGTLIRWQERQNAERSRMTLSTYTVLPEVERYSFLIDLLATSQQAVLLAGLPGVGKTALMQNLVQPKHNLTRIAMSSGLSPSELQQVIEFKMDMLTKRTVTARTISSKGKVHNQQVFFIDDINMAANDHCGTQPCLEVLRQIMAHGGVYNIDKHSFKPISNAAFVAACTSPAVAGIGNSAACHQMSRRLIRLFTVIAFHPPSLDSLKKLYTGMLQSWLEEFPVYSVAHHTRMANAIVSACHDLYRQVSARLPPTPQKALHVFSLHDLSRVVQGMLLLTPRVRGKPRPVRTRASSRTWSMVSGDTSTSEGTGKSVSIFPVPPSDDAGDGRTPRRGLSWAGSHSDTPVAPPLQKLVVRLWCHEAIRTFADRLFWDKDVQWFREALTSTVEKHFCTGEEGYDPSRPFVMPAIPETPADQKKSGTPRKYLSPPPRALSAASQEISAVTGEEEGEEDEDLGRETELGTQTSERTTDGDGYETVATDYETDITTPESRMTRATTEYSEYETATTPGTEATTPVSEEEEEEEDDDRETDAETVKTEAEDTLDTDDEATTIKTGFEGTSVIEEDEAESTAKSPSAWSTKSDSQEDADLTTTGTGEKESGLPGTSGTTQTEVSTTTTTGDSGPTPTPRLDHHKKGRKSKSPRKSTSPDKTGKKSSSPGRKSVTKEEKTPQVKPEGALKSREEQRPTTKEKGSRPGVTFKPGLVADSSQEDYLGPLVPLELVLPPGDDIMNIIFSKFITGTARTDGIEGYMETGLDQLSSSLGRFLSNYNAKTTHKLDMVFFKQAIHHIVRLTRVLATTGGHALLIGTSNFTGRVSTSKLATFIVRAKFFHAVPAKDRADNRSNLHKVLKEAFFVSGVQGREGVLLVGEEMGMECLQDICSLMSEGTCPGLYDDDELMTIANQIMQGTVPGKHSDKFELALERYHKRIRTNLHVVVTMDLTGPVPLHHRLRQFPTLLLRSTCVDMYSRWTFEARVNCAMNWIAQDSSKRSDILWEMLGSTTSLTAVAHAMAYIHRSAQAALQRCFHDNHQLRRLFTPLTYMEFIDLFKSITAKLSREEKASIAKYEGCLSKVQEAQATIASQQADVEELLPRLDEAREITQEWVYKVEEGRASYSKALQQCKEEEDRIEVMQGPLEQLRQLAQAEFDKVNPAYTAAVIALRSLSHSDLDEIKSYRIPPPGVVLVVNALCIIFGVELDWELGHQLISRGNFFEELEFYDKNNMPEAVFQKLKVFVRDPHFDPRVIKGSSKAAESICMWVHAVFQYAAIHRDIKPKLEKLAEAEKEMNNAQAALGTKRVHAEEEKNNLESTIRSHTDSVRHSKTIERQIKVLKDKTAKCQNVLTNMEAPISIWNVQLRKAQKRLSTAPGDSLITAACVCYLGPFDSITRQTLLQDWLHHCRTGEKIKSYKKQMMVPSSLVNSREDRGKGWRGNSRRSARREEEVSDEQTVSANIAVRDNFTLQSTLSTTTEQVMWRQMGMPTNLTATQNALLMRSCWQNRKRCWPLLVDPDSQAETWVRALQETTTSWEGEQQAAELAKDGSRPSSTTTQHTRDQSLPDSRDKTRPSSTSQQEEGTAGFGDSRSTTPLADRDTPSSQRTPDFQLDLGMYVDRPISLPEGGVEVVSADDPFLEASLIRAVVTGYCILVTHVERTGIMSPVLRKLLDRATLESNKAMKLGDQDIPFHPGFCLYLSISSPLYLKGAGMAEIPMHKTAVVDLSVSQAGVVKLLLKETLKLEKPEYEGQRRSLQADLIQSEKDLQEEKDHMMQKVLELQTPILEDPTMLDALQSFQERTLEIDATIAETQSLQAQVGEKKRDYQPVASHGAILFEAIRRIATIHPMYHYPLTNFIQMFITSVKSRQRGKGAGNVGAIKARVIELNDCVTRVSYSRLERSMFSQHALLFALLIVVDKMKEAGEMTEEEWAVFANGIEGLDDLQKDSSSSPDTSLTKPDWLSFETWVQCALLESLSCFQGLRESLSRHSQHWQEYFSCPPILLNPVTGPTLLNLNLIQKAILWRIIKPEQMIGICESLVLYKLGHVVRRPDARSVEEAFLASEHHTPIVLLLPASPDAAASYNSCKGYASMDPFWEIKKLAKAHGMHGKVQQVMLGLREEMSGAAAVVERGMAKGHWVVFNNCQMADGWSHDVLELVKTIVTSAAITVSLQEEGDTADETDSQDGETVTESPKMNPNFRLWLVTTAEASTSIPGVALQHGVKLAYELPQDIPATVGTTYSNAVWTAQPLHAGQPRRGDQLRPLLTSLSLAHSLLLHRRKYGIAAFTAPHHWNQANLNAAVELLQGLLQGRYPDEPDGLSEGYQTLVGDLVYGGRVTDLMDMDVVTSMVKQWTVGLDQNSIENSPIVSALLSNVKGVMHSGPQASQNRADLNSDPTLVGLDASAAQVFHLQKSKNMLDELEMITGVHGIRSPFLSQYNGTLALLEKLQSYLQLVPELQLRQQERAAGRADFVQEFFTTEVSHYKALLQRVTADVGTMQSALKGEVGLTAEMEQLLSAVVQHKVPQSWLVNSYPTATGLADWVQTLQARVEALQQYVQAEGGPATVNLAAFINPVGFLNAVLLQHCRQQFRDVQTFQYQVKVLEPSDLAINRPSSGIYLSGLHVHGALWDGKNGGLQEPPREHVTCSLPKVWMKIVDTSLHKKATVPTYNCPMYISAPKNDILGADNVVMHLELPTASDTGVLIRRRVFVTSTL